MKTLFPSQYIDTSGNYIEDTNPSSTIQIHTLLKCIFLIIEFAYVYSKKTQSRHEEVKKMCTALKEH